MFRRLLRNTLLPNFFVISRFVHCPFTIFTFGSNFRLRGRRQTFWTRFLGGDRGLSFVLQLFGFLIRIVGALRPANFFGTPMVGNLLAPAFIFFEGSGWYTSVFLVNSTVPLLTSLASLAMGHLYIAHPNSLPIVPNPWPAKPKTRTRQNILKFNIPAQEKIV